MEKEEQHNIAYDDLKERAKKLFNNKQNEIVNFWPYIGCKYFNANFKILVVGESHYNCDQCKNRNKDLTIDDFSNSYLSIGSKDQLGYYYQFESFAQYPLEVSTHLHELLGRRRTAEFIISAENNSKKSDYVWDYLAFYNFYQRLVGCCSNCGKWYRKDKESFHKEAKVALSKVVSALKPHLIIIWENKRFTEAKLELENRNGKEYFQNVEVFRINHPARTLIRNKFVLKWKQDGFLEKVMFDSYENDIKLLEKIEKNVIKQLDCGINRKRGRQYLFFELFVSKKDGEFVNSTRNYVCDITCAGNLLTLRFYTRNYSIEESKRILNQIDEKYEYCDNLGRCDIMRSTFNECFMEKITEILKKLVEYRKNLFNNNLVP